MDWQIISYFITASISLMMGIKTINEYIKQGTQKRAELLAKYRDKFHSTETAKLITRYLEEDNPELRKIDRLDRYLYLGFFEELGVLLNSKLISQDTIFYFFGYYILRAKESRNFWTGINGEALYWREFYSLAEKMERIQNKKLKRFNSIKV